MRPRQGLKLSTSTKNITLPSVAAGPTKGIPKSGYRHDPYTAEGRVSFGEFKEPSTELSRAGHAGIKETGTGKPGAEVASTTEPREEVRPNQEGISRGETRSTQADPSLEIPLQGEHSVGKNRNAEETRGPKTRGQIKNDDRGYPQASRSVERQKSPTDYGPTNAYGSAERNRTISNRYADLPVGLSVPACRPEPSVCDERRLEGSYDATVEHLEIGPLRTESVLQIRGVSEQILAHEKENCVGALRESVPALEADRRISVGSFHSKRSVQIPCRSRLRHGCDRIAHRTYPYGGQKPRSEKIHRSVHEPTGTQEAARDEPLVAEQTVESNPVPRCMMYTEGRTIFDPGGNERRIYDPGGVDWNLPIQHLIFSSAEWEVLRNHQPENDLEIVVHPISSDREAIVKVRTTTGMTKVSRSRKPCSLPLAHITKNRISFDALQTLPIPMPPESQDFLSWITTNRLKATLEKHPKYREARDQARHHVSRHVLRDMMQLSADKILEERPFSSGTLEVPLFKVPKSDGNTSRLIGDCRTINGLLPRPGNMELPGIHSVMKRLLSGNFMAQRDGTSYFYQFELSDEASSVFGSRVGNERGIFRQYWWKVLPMGFSYAPGIAQHTSLHLCRNIRYVAGTGEIVPWVDNFLMSAGTQEQADTLLKSFEKVMDHVQCEYKGDDKPRREMNALGLYFNTSSDDTDAHFVTLSSDFKLALQQSHKKIASRMTTRIFLDVFGHLMWANHSVGREPLCRWTQTMQFLRTACRKSMETNNWDADLVVPEEVQREMHEFLHAAVDYRVTYAQLREQRPEVDLWSDASGKAWGYVRFGGDDSIAATSEKYEGLNIFVAELLAASDLLHTEWKNGASVVRSNIDNAAARNAITKGHSSSQAGDLILRKLFESIPTGVRGYTRQIPTSCMIADGLSRNEAKIPERCDHEHRTEEIRWRKK